MNITTRFSRFCALVVAALALQVDAGMEVVTAKYGYIGTHPAISPPFTYGAWVKLYSKASSATIFSIAGTTDNYHQLQFNNPTASFLTFTRQASTANTALAYATNFGTVNTNVWYFVAAVHSDVANRVITVNGVPYATNTDSRTITITKVGLGLRTENAIPATTPEYFNGQLAEMAIWGVALSANELMELAGGGNPSAAVSPIKVRPDKLLFYAPLNGSSSVHERNETGPLITLSGAPAKPSTFKLIR